MGMREAYGRINDALNEAFFDGRHAGQPVYLVLDTAAREDIASQLGIVASNLEAFICACAGMNLEKRGDPYSGMLSELEAWRKAGMATSPPFTTILFALSHAAAVMGDDGLAGRNDYYTRLAQVTHLGRQPLMLHGISTEPLWKGLNEWLLQNNYELGRPTAKALNSWVYVGYALSQAIVRAGDREQFHDLFHRFGFSGNEPISQKEMGFYLAHWMNSSRPSPRMKKAWKDRELRERIIEAALAELAAWSTSDRRPIMGGMKAARATRLSLLANVVEGLMGRKLELRLGRAGDGIQEGPFTLEGSVHAFHLANDDFGTFATMSPSPLGSNNIGLGQSFTFKQDEEVLSWQPRLIVPFALSPSGQWIEVARTSFGAQHVVLVRDANNLPKKVELLLADAAMVQPTKETPSDMRGLPVGWVLYANVQVRQPSVEPPQDLACLVPLANEGSLAVTGGLQLLRGFYHSQATLEARFVAPQGPTHIGLFVSGDDTRPAIASTSSETAECVLAASPGELGAAPEVRIKAWHGDGRPDIVEIFLRDANTPTPLGRDGRGRLSYASVMSASSAPKTSTITVEGFSTTGNFPFVQGATPGSGVQPPPGETEARQEALLSQALATHVGNQTCVERGYHYWRCETKPPTKPRTTPLEQRCTGCELAFIVQDRGKKEATLLPAVAGKLQPPRERKAINTELDHDLLLDALSFLGNGSWGRLQSLISQPGDENIMPRSVAQDLFLLGFIDIELRKGSNAIKSWCVPPPSLVFHASGEAFLAGFRSSGLLRDIEAAVTRAGGTFMREHRAGAPAKVVVGGLEASAARLMLASVRDPHGRIVSVEGDAASSLAGACALLDPIEGMLSPVSIGQPENLEWFNARKGHWEKVRVALNPGAYRWNEGLQYYALRDSRGDCWSGPYQVAKLLAARSEGVHLHGHDLAGSIFLASLGSDVPGLLGRALVACSGDLPILGQGLVSYANVSPAIANSILGILYPESSRAHEEIKSYQCV